MASILLQDISSPIVAEEKRKSRRGYQSVAAVDPHDGSLWHVLISDDRITRTALRSEAQAYELAETVRWMLLHPRRIFLCKRDDENADSGWCYCGIPKRAFGTAKDGKSARIFDPWSGQVFLVFVDRERVICNWYWDACDSKQHDYPTNYETRFKGPAI